MATAPQALQDGQHMAHRSGSRHRGALSERPRHASNAGEGMALVEISQSTSRLADRHCCMEGSVNPGFTPWTDAELQYLRDNWEGVASKTIARNLGRSYSAVLKMGRRLKLKRDAPVTPAWSDDDLQLLREKWGSTSSVDIARLLGRSYSAVKLKAYTEGLRRGRGNRIHPGEKKPRPNHPRPSGLPTAAPAYRAAVGPSEKAADFLRAHDRVAMYRSDADGKANPQGDHWRYGNVTLTDAEVVAKAERKGFDGDAWKALAS